MQSLDLIYEAAALAGYTIDSSTQGALNKTKALRRLNFIKADIISRFGGRWPSNYREGWLPVVPLLNLTVTWTPLSNTVTFVSAGTDAFSAHYFTGNIFPSTITGGKILGPDGKYYKIASVASNGLTLQLTEPYQGVDSNSLYTGTINSTTVIWIDEYPIYPDVLTIGGFINYDMCSTMREAWPANYKDSFPKQISTGQPGVYEVIGRSDSAVYSTGTITGTANTHILTGSGTSWLANVEPGAEITVNGTRYHARSVDSDTQITLYQLLSGNIALLSTYTAVGKNRPIIRLNYPSNQAVIHYWYYAKDRPFVNDADEDWIAEEYPRVIVNGMSYFDYLDKNDVPRGMNSERVYEDSIKNMKVAADNMYTGVRTIGLYLPPSARE